MKQVTGRPPTLKLRQVAAAAAGRGGAAAEVGDSAKEEVRLDSWKQDHIRDFLRSKLKAHQKPQAA